MEARKSADEEGRDGAVSVEWSRKAGLRAFGAVRQGKNSPFQRRVSSLW
jgi:hypothetical protein